MAEQGYKQLLSYKLAQIAFDVGWEFVPWYYDKHEDGRQRDQIKQALRSLKQNIVEGSAERSLSSKLKLYDVAKSSGQEACEDFEDIIRLENMCRWDRHDSRLNKLRYYIEGYPRLPPSDLLRPTLDNIRRIGGIRGTGGIRDLVEIVANYQIDLLTRDAYLLDKQINAVERKHTTEGGYRERLLQKRLQYRKRTF